MISSFDLYKTFVIKSRNKKAYFSWYLKKNYTVEIIAKFGTKN